MTWDATAKTLTLYVNGEVIQQATNQNINLESIRNGGDLQLGKGGGPLKRDIFMVRLWNRLIDKDEVSLLWESFKNTKQHELPIGFHSTGLRSEWLMQETCDAKGNIGMTHIQDSTGTNHLELRDGAVLYRGGRGLTLLYPNDGEMNVHKSACLKASGNSNLTSETLTKPLHYNFQIDESEAFDSSQLKDSGWIAHYGIWKPILKPDTQYYWRVKVRDSRATRAESAFSPSKTFRTEPRQAWYARPAGTAYGRGDGKSYDDAWSGIQNIVWGESGVEAGDDLYICGVHVCQSSLTNEWRTIEYIQASGFSEEYPITIRMDYAGDPGTCGGQFYTPTPSSGANPTETAFTRQAI